MKNSEKKYRIGLIIKFIVLSFAINAQPVWQVNPAEFQYTMTVTGVGLFSCDTTSNTNDQIAAFINGECRGYANFETVVNGMALAYLTIYDNLAQGSEIQFVLYDSEVNTTYESPANLTFVDGAIIGNAGTPYRFRNEYAIESLYMPADSILDYFVAGSPVSNLFMVNENGDTLSATFDFLNDNLGIDNAKFDLLGSLLIIEENVKYGVQDSYQLHIAGTTDNGCTFRQVFILKVINTNTPPKGLKTDLFSIRENEPIGTLVGLLEADDDSPDDSHTFTFDPDHQNSDQSAFEIVGNELLTYVALDYEKQNWYTLRVVINDASGNSVIDTLYVQVTDVIEFNDLKASNLLTPNNDGHNDTFFIPNVELFSNYELLVFNAQGSQVYSTRNYDNSWEGFASNGSALPTGTYYYVFSDTENTSNSFKGEIHIYRTNKF